MNKTFLLWAAIAGAGTYYYVTNSGSAWQIPGVMQVYNLGWNFGQSGTVSTQ